jgi:hypothetical protein
MMPLKFTIFLSVFTIWYHLRSENIVRILSSLGMSAYIIVVSDTYVPNEF